MRQSRVNISAIRLRLNGLETKYAADLLPTIKLIKEGRLAGR